MKGAKPKTASLRQNARAYLANKSRREVARLLGKNLPLPPAHQPRKPARIVNSWQDWERNLLGKITDRDFARQTGRRVRAVRAMRRYLKIAHFGGPVNHRWTRQQLILLGKYPDREVATRLNKTLLAVSSARFQQGIERFGGKVKPWSKREDKLLLRFGNTEMSRRTKRSVGAASARRMFLNLPRLVMRPWTLAEEALPGTMPDPVLAKKIGRTTEAVKTFRKKRGIPPFNRQRRWTDREDRVLKKYSRQEAVRRLQRPLHSIEYRLKQLNSNAPLGDTSRRWSKKEITLLGQHSDMALARRLRRTRSAVTSKRRELKIHSHAADVRPWTEEENSWLGKMSDAELAKKCGRVEAAVKHRRNQRRLYAFRAV
jgi:hypothetical protein